MQVYKGLAMSVLVEGCYRCVALQPSRQVNCQCGSNEDGSLSHCGAWGLSIAWINEGNKHLCCRAEGL